MAKLQPVRGTHDILPDEMPRYRNVFDAVAHVGATYGYGEIATPIFEFTEVFKRTLGDTSDVVTKEMYTFADRGGEGLTLRPEGTAGVARAVISGGLLQQVPLKYFYRGPMFRYERPQKGRMRQFHQIGVELLGVPEPSGDIEVIALGADILDRLGVLGDTMLEINTIGDMESRNAYRTALVAYLEGHIDRLSDDSRERLHRNPLRVLDSKDADDREVVANAPRFDDYLTPHAADFFAAVLAGLDRLGIPYRRNVYLVRGLDYYCHTTFEFVTDRLGAQGTVLAGGRYDGLIGQMGGAETPGVGWAAGVERLSLLAEPPAATIRPVALVPLGPAAEAEAMVLAHRLRKAGVVVDLGYGGNLKKRMKRADRVGAAQAVIFGDDELARGAAQLKSLDDGAQTEVALADLVDRLAARG
ncbi:histidine--tRNA ligase [Tistrella mobilis]|uniref:Histidine--tRNA ligase n=1 Tax=Tistrella mobilis (strain KA081020-065) TaxID=1110502 RepID=I3THI0_TISMK|nr:histidine--tRNA ligase [Tistrella mobilis]AFK52218.1 Histidyl-tRNA synthetase, class IIa [Tistrella mobilis KA081020-065]